MNEEQFDALIQKLTKYARQNPAKYKFRIGLLAALGYAYVLFVLILLCGIFWIATRTFVFSILIGLGILRSLWLSFPKPNGIEISRSELPELFALIDELTIALQAPTFHHIILDNQHNAGVIQVPRFGFLGWYQNYLFLGLPLMQSLSPEQFRAVVAHELGHLSGNHSRFAGWIYRLRNIWYQFGEGLERSGQGGSILFSGFFKWYAPFFRAYSFVLARANEYEADRCAAELAGSHHAAEALINLEIKGNFFHKSVWKPIFKQALDFEQPPDGTIAKVLQEMRKEVPAQQAAISLNLALVEKTNHEDTHPCLADRLSAFGYLPVGYDVPIPVPLMETAAERFLGEKWNRFTADLDEEWKKAIAPVWKQIHLKARQRSQNLALLETKAQINSLTTDSAWKRAQLTAEFKGEANAIPLYRELLAQNPHHALANYELGQILLEKDDSAGISHIEIAIEQDSSLVIPGCQSLYAFLKQQGKLAAAQGYHERATKHYHIWEKAAAERKGVSDRDRFEPHNLSLVQLAEISEQISHYPQIKQAYLVRKVIVHFPEKPCYILAIMQRYIRLEANNYINDDQLIDLLLDGLNFSGDVFGIVLNGYNTKLGQAIRKVENASIFRS
ncbi:MAG TPA: M48 family metalloprotease [Leptolyngbyaceae cyanobacterium]